MQVLAVHHGVISVKELSAATGIKVDDVILTLQNLQLIQYHRGQHVLCVAPDVIQWCVLLPCRLPHSTLADSVAVTAAEQGFSSARPCASALLHMSRASAACCGFGLLAHAWASLVRRPSCADTST